MTQKFQRKVHVIVGPTCSGKTALALDLAQKYSGEIISADSRQVYRHMDIGTGKMPVGKDLTATVWGYDLVDPDENFTAFDYAIYAQEKIAELFDRREYVFLVGGTGLYIDMTTGRVRPANVQPDHSLREELALLTLAELQTKLRNIDPAEFAKVDIKNKVRLIRELEKAILPSTTPREKYLPVDYKFIGLTAPREFLYSRVDAWAEHVWANGLIEETRSLLNMFPTSRMLKGLVYKSVCAYLSQNLSEKEAITRIKYDLHAYVRRQQTYFKKMPNITWIDITKDKFVETVYNSIDG